MILYSGTTCPFSHRCRFLLYEKGMDFEVRDVDVNNIPADILTMNPYGEVPVLVEREFFLYEANIICEYLDERFPHPQLMPAEPVLRARVRLFMFNFERELFTHVKTLESRQADEAAKEVARTNIRDQLTAMAPIFTKNKYIFGEDFTMLDVVMAPLLWRLGLYGIELPKSAAALHKYAERLFSRQSFIGSMTPSEKVMRR